MKSDAYDVAAFAMDGSLVGTGSRQRAALSPKWLAIADDLVRSATQFGRAALSIKSLDHLALKLTCVRGAGLATYYAHGVTAASTLMLRGDDPHAEADLMRMFVDALSASPRVASLRHPNPFCELFSLKKRPLHVVVQWVQHEIDEDDVQLVQELSAHVAGAVLTDPAE
jgi:hypothetical protein